MHHQPHVQAFFDEPTFTVSYVVADRETGRCAVIDSVLGYDSASGRTCKAAADRLIGYIRAQGMTLDWILETHVHADHLSAASYIKQQLRGRLAIGSQITRVQDVFGKLFNVGEDFRRDGSQFDVLLHDGDRFRIGSLEVRAIHTPGHTPACMTYLIGDAAFVGDTLFMPDYGTARCDFPGGDAHQLYRSIQRIYALPAETRLFLCHDYKAPGREEYRWETTVAEQRARNVQIRQGVGEADFVRMRTERDAGLAMPRLLLPSVQVNMRAGDLPPPESNGLRYLKIPIDAL